MHVCPYSDSPPTCILHRPSKECLHPLVLCLLCPMPALSAFRNWSLLGSGGLQNGKIAGLFASPAQYRVKLSATLFKQVKTFCAPSTPASTAWLKLQGSHIKTISKLFVPHLLAWLQPFPPPGYNVTYPPPYHCVTPLPPSVYNDWSRRPPPSPSIHVHYRVVVLLPSPCPDALRNIHTVTGLPLSR